MVSSIRHDVRIGCKSRRDDRDQIVGSGANHMKIATAIAAIHQSENGILAA